MTAAKSLPPAPAVERPRHISEVLRDWERQFNVREAARRARRALELRLERHHQRLPCHAQDWPCCDGYTCWKHQATDDYVDAVLRRFDRLQLRKALRAGRQP